MERLNKKIIIYLTISALVLIIGIPTIYKVITNHYQLLRLIEEKKIAEAALRCKHETKCLNSTITLQELYDLNYLKEQYDPITKKVYANDSKIVIKKTKVELKLD